jgi:broad specificity phosphatase PhoE
VSQRILLVRHGLTEWNREGRFQGHRDPQLSEDGRAQGTLLARRLAASDEDQPTRIISSPLTRAAETAEIIAAALPPPRPSVAMDRRWMEIGQGDWEGKTHAELRVTDAERYAEWRLNESHHQTPGGEPIEEVVDRVRAALTQLVTDAEDDNLWPVCVVAHGGCLRVAAHVLLDIRLDRAWGMEMDNASMSVSRRVNGLWQLVHWNDTTHLLGRMPLHVAEEDGEALAL